MNPDQPQATVEDVRFRLAHNYCIFQPQVVRLLKIYDDLEKKHRADLRAIARLEAKNREQSALIEASVADSGDPDSGGYDRVSGVAVRPGKQ